MRLVAQDLWHAVIIVTDSQGILGIGDQGETLLQMSRQGGEAKTSHLQVLEVYSLLLVCIPFSPR